MMRNCYNKKNKTIPKMSPIIIIKTMYCNIETIACKHQMRHENKSKNTDADIYVSSDLFVWEACQLLQSKSLRWRDEGSGKQFQTRLNKKQRKAAQSRGDGERLIAFLSAWFFNEEELSSNWATHFECALQKFSPV